MSVKCWAKRHRPELRVVVNFWTFFFTPLAGANLAEMISPEILITLPSQLLISLASAGIATILVTLKEVSQFLAK